MNRISCPTLWSIFDSAHFAPSLFRAEPRSLLRGAYRPGLGLRICRAAPEGNSPRTRLLGVPSFALGLSPPLRFCARVPHVNEPRLTPASRIGVVAIGRNE